MDVLKIGFGQGIYLRELGFIAQYHIAVIGENDMAMDVQYGMVCG
tara:strand:- start:10912 stop:11046 length:135 start_codon:yes stop_codon:yes gene_type:complete